MFIPYGIEVPHENLRFPRSLAINAQLNINVRLEKSFVIL